MKSICSGREQKEVGRQSARQIGKMRSGYVSGGQPGPASNGLRHFSEMPNNPGFGR